MAKQPKGGGITWTEETWNPTRGCSRVSEGCRNCYAERMAARFAGPGEPYEGLAKTSLSGPRWTGKVRMVREHLTDPLRWRRPRRVFVDSMSDLFHEKLSQEEIARVFAVMFQAPQHQFQVLTKRASRMATLLRWSAFWKEVDRAACRLADTHRLLSDGDDWKSGDPLPNVWLGVSVEDQATANERIPLLLQTPAAVRFVSYEPALGPVDFTRIGHCMNVDLSALEEIVGFEERPALDWIIVGGESGPGARRFDVAWARTVIDQCRAAGVAVFVKQLGAEPTTDARTARKADEWIGLSLLKDHKGGDPSEWPADLRVQEYPERRLHHDDRPKG